MGKKIKQIKSCQSFSPIRDIRDGIIITKKGHFVKLMEFSPINFGLRSNDDKNLITAQYAAAIRSFPTTVQLKVVSKKADVGAYISGIEENIKKEAVPGAKELMKEQLEMIEEIGATQGVSRRFFLAFPYEQGDGLNRSPSWAEIRGTLNRQAEAIRGNLRVCGNEQISATGDDSYLLETLYGIMSRGQSESIPFTDRQTDVIARYAASNTIDFFKHPDIQLPVNDFIAPGCIDTETSPKYIIVDGVHYMFCYLPSTAYPVRVVAGWMQTLVGLGEGIDIDLWLHKEPPGQTQTALQYKLRWNRIRLRKTEDTSNDFEDLQSAVDSGYYLKSGVASGDDFAYMATMITITGASEREINFKYSEIKRIFAERELQIRQCMFQQIDAFRASIPICEYDPNIFRKSRRNILCSDFSSSYMFTSSELCDKGGVILGVDDVFKSPVLINPFDTSKYINANMAILGSSGSGKSFTMQTLAIRMRENQTQVFIIAPLKGWEFEKSCAKVGGSFVRIAPGSGQNINIMEIRKRATNETYDTDGTLVSSGAILAQKIQQLHIFFKLLVPDITSEEKQYLDEALQKTYNSFGITDKNKSLLDPADPTKYRKMPILSDLHNELKKMGEPAKRLHSLLTRYVSGSASSFNAQTNVNLDNKFVVLDVSALTQELLPIGMFIALDYVWDKCKEDLNARKCVFIDETWKLVCSDAPIEAAKFVVEVFRTIRGMGGSAVAATQNLSDFFSLDGGSIGTAIINNAKTKLILRSEKEEAAAVASAMGLTDEELKRIKMMERGTCLLVANDNHVFINVKATDTEEMLISTDPKARDRAKRRVMEKRARYSN